MAVKGSFCTACCVVCMHNIDWVPSSLPSSADRMAVYFDSIREKYWEPKQNATL